MNILILNGSPRPNGNTRRMIDAFIDSAMFSYKGDFPDYLGLEDMGVYTAHGPENGSPEKPDEIRNFGVSLK